MRNLLIAIWTITALLTTSTVTLGSVTEVDTFANSWGQIRLISPAGQAEIIDLSGPSEIHVFFEGSVEGTADDNDIDGLDEVATELVAMNLTGVSATYGPVVLSLNPGGPQSVGEIEETADNTTGTLDLPPFAPTGTADSYFDVFFKLELAGMTLHNISPARLVEQITEKPPAHGDIYQAAGSVQLYNENGEPTGFFVGPFQYEPNPAQHDFGDAPDDGAVARYPTLASNNGASHIIVPGFMLGASVDDELDGQPDSSAAGDDNDGNDDEDGVTFITWPLVPGRPAVVEVTASTDGLLYAWIDFNTDDSWAQAGDNIFNAQPLTPGMNTLVFQVPMTAGANITTFGRFRFTSDANVSYDGPASDGEVEDHTVKIKERCGIKWVQLPDETENGVDICVTNTVEVPRILADDFECTSFGLITDIHIWGFWLNDIVGNITNIQAAIYSDDPVGAGGSDPENLYSKPDKILWRMDFRPGEFTEQSHAKVDPGEYWWDPAFDVTAANSETQISRIDMYIDRTDAFLQEGTPKAPIVYWLAVRVDTDFGEFGWKTRRWPDHYNDDAVFAVSPSKSPDWREMRYPAEHPYDGSSVDLAFIITTDDYCPARADLNCNGFVDIFDFTIFAAQWLQITP